MKRVVITGGAGFVGGNLAIGLRQALGECEIVAFDNLHRSGSELHVPRLEREGVTFVRGDVRGMQDLEQLCPFDALVECSAEPSVLAGVNSSPDYLVRTNLHGATNCAELCRREGAALVFLSTSRVYPLAVLQQLNLQETDTRFELAGVQAVPGVTERGIGEDFPMVGQRSLYGATKYAAELILEEYRHAFSLPIVINRCGVIAGPWQFGNAAQGIVAFWLASHLFQQPLRYIGFGGTGRQVRDVLHVVDLVDLIRVQIEAPERFGDGVYNVGGGRPISVSLTELTELCRAATGNHVTVGSSTETRYADIPLYLSDTRKIEAACDWRPRRGLEQIVADTCAWLRDTPQVHQLFS